MTALAKHRLFLALTALEVVVVAALLAHGHVVAQHASAADVPARRELARRLRLTDLSLWTEARYTRHPTQADLSSAFQDFPASLEHFPAGSVVVVPPGLESFQRRPPARAEARDQCGD